MRAHCLIPLVAITAFVIPLIETPTPIAACAIAPIKGGYSVDVADETALIVWDSQTKTEHFVRTATFASTSSEFGFLVPTPTQPELGEVEPGVFTSLSTITAPKIEFRTETVKVRSSGGCGAMSSAPKSSAGAANEMAPKGPSVEVLDKKRVGDFDAVVLKATDGAVLRKWLSDNGYDARPELEKWLDVYTQLKWIITAFKIAANVPNAGPQTIRSSAVRMSFKTERPFYPYREPLVESPTATPQRSRLLRLFVLADAHYEGKIGNGPAWPGQTVWSKPLDTVQATNSWANIKLPPANSSEQKWRLSEFEDRSSPRPATDEVYFSKSDNQVEVERPPTIYTNTVYVNDDSGKPIYALIGCGLIVALAGGTLLLGLWLFRRLRG